MYPCSVCDHILQLHFSSKTFQIQYLSSQNKSLLSWGEKKAMHQPSRKEEKKNRAAEFRWKSHRKYFKIDHIIYLRLELKKQSISKFV